MKVGYITRANTKGQVVIPKEYRQLLGIKDNISLNIIATSSGIFIHPVRSVVSDVTDKSSYVELLERTQGAWAGDSWPRTRKNRKKLELAAATRRRQEQW